MEIEREIKYLVSGLPENLDQYKSKKMVDIYIPREQGHAAIRIRQQGSKFFITKKTAIQEENRTVLGEETMEITEEDFTIFKSMKNARILEKTRFYYPLNGKVVEIDIFAGDLDGLITAEIEFNSIEELNAFQKPGFCTVDVSDKDFLAGGVLYKSTYEDIENSLSELGYAGFKNGSTDKNL